MKVDISKILEVLGLVFLVMIANFILYSTFGELYITLFTIVLVIVPLCFMYKLIKKIIFKATDYKE